MVLILSNKLNSLLGGFISKLDRARTSEEMDRTLNTDFFKTRATWDILTKISELLQLWKIDFLTKSEGCSSKIVPATPIGSFLCFWGKSKFWAPVILIFCAKQVFIRVNNWWKFSVDISNYFLEIQNLLISFFQVSPIRYD